MKITGTGGAPFNGPPYLGFFHVRLSGFRLPVANLARIERDGEVKLNTSNNWDDLEVNSPKVVKPCPKRARMDALAPKNRLVRRNTND
jgi:hypothetical protein